MPMKTHGSLFSGIGCSEIAATRLGYVNTFACEIDPFARQVFRRHNSCHVFDDVTKIETLPKVDVLTAGFPCQDASIANVGSRIGNPLDKARTGLFWEIVRLLKTSNINTIVLENVNTILNMCGSTIIQELHNIGYCVGWTVLTASQFGAKHRRRRVFFIASRCNKYAMAESLQRIHAESKTFQYVTPGLDNFKPSPETDWKAEGRRIKTIGNGIFVPCIEAVLKNLPKVESGYFIGGQSNLFSLENHAFDVPTSGVFDGQCWQVTVPKEQTRISPYPTPTASDGKRVAEFANASFMKQIGKNTFKNLPMHFVTKKGYKPIAEIFEALMGLPIGYTRHIKD